jgi:hypothetical protein
MELKEQNWKNFCAQNLRELPGLWTGYSPQGELFGSFQLLRSFQSNKEQTEITHTSRYTFADGRTEEKAWQFNKQSSNLPDGLVHPEQPSMRSFFFDQGASASAVKQLETGLPCRIQLGFKHEDLVSSVVIFYDDRGSLMRTVCIRLDAAGFPSKYWSTELNLLPERNLSGNWKGTSVTMTPDLKVSPAVSTQLHWPWEGNETFFFPDGISLSCPSQVSISPNFTIAANWLVTSSDLQQLIVKYDDSGAFSSVTFEQFHLPDAVGAS